MNKKIVKTVKLITTFILIVSLTLSMTGCSSLQQAMQSIIPTEEPTKLGAGNSDTGFFVGERYEEVPTINHRTEEEIATTGLTAQDVLNAYDQLATDIIRLHYSDSFYSYLPQEFLKEITENAVGEFESITQYSYMTSCWEDAEEVFAPFYALDPTYSEGSEASFIGSGHLPGSSNFSAYPIVINFKVYIDGVAECHRTYAGVEKNQFEQTMIAFGQKPYFLDRETYREKVKGLDDEGDTAYYAFLRFLEQDVYEPMKITRETIMNATPEQLKAIYTMISSIRSIGFEYKLP